MMRTLDRRRAELERVHAQASNVVLDSRLDRGAFSDGISSQLLVFQELISDALETLGLLQDDPSADADGTANLAFAAALELKQLRVRVDQARADTARCDAPQLCEIARGTLRRCSHAVVESLCEGTQSPLESEARADVAIALAIRRQYAALARYLDANGSEEPEALATSIRKAGNALAAVIGGPWFRAMRIDDRRILRSLHERAVAWFGARETRVGVQLCSDLRAAAELLQMINQRQELRHHDQRALAHAQGSITLAATREELVQLFAPLAGRHPTIDRLLGIGDDPPSLDELLAVVARLAAELGGEPDRGHDAQAPGGYADRLCDRSTPAPREE